MNKLKNITILPYLGLSFAVGIYYLQGGNVLIATLFLIASIVAILYALQILTRDFISSLFLVLTLFVGLSFLPLPFQRICFILTLAASIAALTFNKKYFRDTLDDNLRYLSNIKLTDWPIWAILALHILTFSWFYHGTFYAIDLFSPAYELSIGHSYQLSIFHPPDLSYSGKLIRYHFISTQLPIFLSHISGVSLFSSAYFITPVLLTFIFFLFYYAFFRKYPDLFLAPFIFLTLPLFAWNPSEIESILERIVASTSYELGLLLIAMSIYFLITQKRALLLLAASILLLTKASFFLTFLGGLGLYYLRVKNFKNFLIEVPLLGIIFVLGFKFFLSGAHAQNHWIIYPSILSLKSWLPKLTFSIFFIISSIIYFSKNKPSSLYCLSAISLAGMVGAFFLTEESEYNSIQFIIASYFAMAVVFGYWFFAMFQNKNVLRKIFVAALYIILIFSLSNCLYNKYKMVLRYSLDKIKTNTYVAKILEGRIKNKRFEKFIVIPSLSKDFMEGYTWLRRNIPQDSIVLFGKHYEAIWNVTPWQPDSGFARSALSAKQMYCENFKYKGILKEKGFFDRFSNSIHFYHYFVLSTPKNQKKFPLFYDYYFFLNEIRDQLSELPITEQWAVNFLSSAHIGYIMLEDKDQPTDFLQEITEQIFKNDELIILKVNEDALQSRQGTFHETDRSQN